MRAVVLRSVAVIGVGLLILGGVLYVASTVDGRAPEVAAIRVTQPLADDPTIALITTSIEVEFSEPVDQASAADALSIEPSVDGGISWSGSTMIFTPSDRLEPATGYRVDLGAGIRDLAGNRMTRVAEPFAFETAGPPTVRLTDPEDGAEGVPLSGPITVTFSALMDTASVEAALRLQPAFAHDLRWVGEVLEIAPVEALEADRNYRVAIGEGAKDVAGVALADPLALTFRTIAPGLATTLVVPADGSDGIAPTTSIAAFFDAPIDPSSISADALSLVPDVAGTVTLVDERGDEPADPNAARVIRFSPSGPLPANTTFEVRLDPAVSSLDAGGLTAPIRWTFTTGPTLATLSNQIAFLSDRGGVSNLWAMNPDGSAPRQVSSELTPILDYAVAPDGSSFVVGDGRRLVLAAASGADRQALTRDGMLEFDPTYAPDGQRIAFARASAETGEGLGIWERSVDGGDSERIEIDLAEDASPAPSGSASTDAIQWLRAPRFAPDGTAIAFVELNGWVGILDLDTGAVRRAAYEAEAPPAWLPDGDAVLLTGEPAPTTRRDLGFDDPIGPLDPSDGVEVAILGRSSGSLVESGLGSAAVASVASDGRIAYLRADGELWLAEDAAHAGSRVPGLEDERIGAASFAPGEDALVVVVIGEDGPAAPGVRIERVALPGGNRSILSNEGRSPRWLP